MEVAPAVKMVHAALLHLKDRGGSKRSAIVEYCLAVFRVELSDALLNAAIAREPAAGNPGLVQVEGRVKFQLLEDAPPLDTHNADGWELAPMIIRWDQCRNDDDNDNDER